MREIKFRGWYTGYKGRPSEPRMLFDSKPGDCLEWRNGGQDIEVMQFTGLKDRNGREIYEGDVVRHEPLGYERRTESLVEFFEGGFLPFSDSDDGAPYPDPEKVEIIGNIYENPELLA